jgi:hypothetical protein
MNGWHNCRTWLNLILRRCTFEKDRLSATQLLAESEADTKSNFVLWIGTFWVEILLRSACDKLQIVVYIVKSILQYSSWPIYFEILPCFEKHWWIWVPLRSRQESIFSLGLNDFPSNAFEILIIYNLNFISFVNFWLWFGVFRGIFDLFLARNVFFKSKTLVRGFSRISPEVRHAARNCFDRWIRHEKP